MQQPKTSGYIVIEMIKSVGKCQNWMAKGVRGSAGGGWLNAVLPCIHRDLSSILRANVTKAQCGDTRLQPQY